MVCNRPLSDEELNAVGFRLAERYEIASSFIAPENGPRGDFSGDGTVGADDINLLFAQLASPDLAETFHLTGDGQVDASDVDELVEHIMNMHYGDTDLGGIVNNVDFGTLAANFGAPLATWSTGDTGSDGDVDFTDVNRLKNNFGAA